MVDQWLWELLRAFQNSSQVLSTISRKVYWIYGIDEPKLYAKATPSSSKGGGHSTSGAPLPPSAELAAKRKQFKRMQSFQTALGGSRYFNNSISTASPPPQRSFVLADTTTAAGRRCILKNLNKRSFSKTQDMASRVSGDAALPTASSATSNPDVSQTSTNNSKQN